MWQGLKMATFQKTKIGFQNFKTNYHFKHVKSIVEYSKGSVLQYFWQSFSNHLSL